MPQTAKRNTTTPRISEILLKMSDACNKHAAYHLSRKSGHRLEGSDDSLPEKCRVDLRNLSLLLPKVEKSYKASAIEQKGPASCDVVHLCEFYCSVVRGSYCPHAPQIFLWGKGGSEGEKDLLWTHLLVFFIFQLLLTLLMIPPRVSPPSRVFPVSTCHIESSYLQLKIFCFGD